jgi:primase-polymerase (primpol)-like protein
MIEIKELMVRAVIVENAKEQGKGTNAHAQHHKVCLSEEERNLLIEDCIRQVMAIIERQKER